MIRGTGEDRGPRALRGCGGGAAIRYCPARHGLAEANLGHAIEFSGRLVRTDGKEVAAGTFDLRFRLHLQPEGAQHVWDEAHAGVQVQSGGAYHVLLGRTDPIDGSTFAAPRWLGVYVERDGALVEVGHRVPMTGATVVLAEQLRALNTRLDVAEALEAEREASPTRLPGSENVDPEARERLLKVHRRLRRLERGGGVIAPIQEKLADHDARLGKLDDADAGRVVRLEDELEDVVGQDGDIIDLLERLEALEAGHGGPMRLVKGDSEIEARVAALEVQNAALTRTADALRKALELITARLAAPVLPPPPPETLPGPLTVQKGGVHVASGGLCVHDIEGRVAGASRREGALHLNSRAGGDVLVGNKESGGVVATGSLRAGRFAGVSATLAVRFVGEAAPGDVVVIEAKKKASIVRKSAAGEAALGVVVERAGVELGEGPVVVAVAGIVRVRVGAPALNLPVGTELVAGAAGLAVAQAAETVGAPTLGRTLGPVASDSGTVEILLHAR